MPWVAPSTRATGYLVTAAVWNQDAVANPKFLARPPSVRVQKSTEQSIASAVWRSMSWNTEVWDTDTMWSSTAATRLDVNTAGKYLVSASIGWAASTAGVERHVGIAVGGSSTAAPAYAKQSMEADVGTIVRRMTVTDIIRLTSTQYIRIQVYQDSGGALNVQHDTVDIASAAVLWVSS